MAQHYNLPTWKVPDCGRIEEEHKDTLRGSSPKYRQTKLTIPLSQDFVRTSKFIRLG